jgi:hypothetical protein
LERFAQSNIPAYSFKKYFTFKKGFNASAHVVKTVIDVAAAKVS